MAKLQHKKEFIEIKDKKKRDTVEKRKEEVSREKEIQKRKLQEAISLQSNFMGVGQNKKVQERIINNFRSFNNTSYLHQPSPQFAPTAMPPSMHQPPSHPSHHPYYYYTQGVSGSTEDHTTIDLRTYPTNQPKSRNDSKLFVDVKFFP